MGAEESQSALRLEKILAVPPERAYAAFVDSEQLRHWWGPVGFTVSDLRFSAAEASDYRIAMQPPEGEVFHLRGVFRAVEPPRRLSFTFVYEEPDADDQETLVTVTFQRAPDGTRVVLDQGPFRTEARRDLHRDGWTDTLDRLEQFLA
jgi:uncharacterized protein YndB with AHSA1/START domain